MIEKLSILVGWTALIALLAACTASAPGSLDPVASGSQPVLNQILPAGSDTNTPDFSYQVIDKNPPSPLPSTPAPSGNPPNPPKPSSPSSSTSPKGGSGGSGNPVSARPLWIISRYVLAKNFKGDEQAAKALLFKSLDIEASEIIFNGQTCKGVTFQRETVNAAVYFSQHWQMAPLDLGINFPDLQVVKTNCSLPGFQEYVRLGDGSLIVQINDVFYFFEPNVAY